MIERYGPGPREISVVRDLFKEDPNITTVLTAERYLREVVAGVRLPEDEPPVLKDPMMEAFLTEEREEFGGRSILAAIRYVLQEEKRRSIFIPPDQVPIPKPKAVIKLSFAELGEKHQVSVQAAYRRVQTLSRHNPEDIVRRGKKYPVLLTDRGLQLVEERFKRSKIPEGLVVVETPELIREFRSTPDVVRNTIVRLRRQNPTDIIARGAGHFSAATNHGINLIRDELESRKAPEGYTAINGAELARSYRIKPSLFYFYLNRLSEIYPQDIVRRGPNMDLIVTGKGRELLYKQLDAVIPVRDTVALDTQELKTKYPIKSSTLHTRLKKLAEVYPGDIIRKGKGTSLLVTAEGRRLIDIDLEAIAKPEGFTVIDYRKIASDYEDNMSIKSLRRLFKKLLINYPQHFAQVTDRREPAATEQGLVLLNDELSKRRRE